MVESEDLAMIPALYTQPNCAECVRAQKWLDDRGVYYLPINIRNHPDLLESLVEQGVRKTPVLDYGLGKIVEGFDPERYKEVFDE